MPVVIKDGVETHSLKLAFPYDAYANIALCISSDNSIFNKNIEV